MKRRLCGCLTVGLLLCSCRPAVPPAGTAAARFDPASVNGEAALAEVRDLLQGGLRDAGTDGAKRAADYLARRLTGIGLQPEIEAFSEAVPGGGPLEFRNVTARIPGTVPGVVVLGAHYDTKSGLPPGFQGANDSGSGVGLLLHLAGLCARGRLQGPAIMLAFLDGEECRSAYGPRDGLHGSRRLAGRLADGMATSTVVAVIILDMIGDRDLTVTIPRNSTPELVQQAFAAAAATGARRHFGLHPGEILDDHQPFLDAGMPAIDLIDFEFGSRAGQNDYWHSPEDTLDKLSGESLATVGRVVLGMLNRLSAQGAGGSGN
jgi:glutaminyl-peptide cyclotransferase